jgi:CheY-like chemotaxis protein
MGIPAEVLPEIFEWYRQAAAGEHAGDAGLGVGLGLVKQLVELHGGTVEAQSEGSGRGATFVVTLPLLRGDVDAAAEDAPQLHVAASPKPLSSLSILLVEDDREWRDAAQVLLSDAGATVRVADSAQEARRALATLQPDVLVSDIAMPDEDGYALMSSLRQAGATFPAIALTALARREDAERSRLAGFQIHMPKPVDPRRLVDTLATLARTGR